MGTPASLPNPEPPADGRIKRRSERVLLQVPIAVKGTDKDGKTFREETRTIVINRNGARISLNSAVRDNDRITIKNLHNQLSCPFRIVTQVLNTLSGQPEWGVECLSPEINFWGIVFPERTPLGSQGETVDALLECRTCKSRELARLTMPDYRTMVAQSCMTRYCPHCDDSTEWEFGFVEEEAKKADQAAAPSDAERRRAKRVTVKLPLRLRLPNGQEEITRTENLSKTGVCFYSGMDLAQGETFQLNVDASLESKGQELTARVVWRRAAGGEDHFLYGVRLLDG
jgi:PilZ domain